MSAISSAALKLFFETGDFPTQAQFIDFIDSYSNTVDKGASVTRNFGEYANVATTGTGTEQLGATFNLPADTLDTIGQLLRITAFGSCVSSANDKTIGVSFGGSNINTILQSPQTNINRWSFVSHVMVRGSNLQAVDISTIWSRQALNATTPRPAANNGTFAVDITVIVPIFIQALTPGGAGELTLASWFVEVLR